MSKLNLKELEVGDIFSESSHYTLKEIRGNAYIFKHQESGKDVILDSIYVESLLQHGDSYQEEFKVGKEDKTDGSLGIRSIWENIHSSQVFTVSFKKQEKNKTKKEYNQELSNQVTEASEMIEKAKRQKKSMAEAYKTALEFVQNNPISSIIEGEERILRGYKVQFTSRDGKYNCMDMEKGEIRPVNINTINWLVINGVKYTVNK